MPETLNGSVSFISTTAWGKRSYWFEGDEREQERGFSFSSIIPQNRPADVNATTVALPRILS